MVIAVISFTFTTIPFDHDSLFQALPGDVR